jgi:FixJ family two-component response regulator
MLAILAQTLATKKNKRAVSLSNQVTIAIVDDDAAVRNATDGLLRALGFAALKYSSAEQFLSSGRVKDISCLITDVRMPGMNGVDLQSKLIAQGYRIPMIFMTAFSEQQTRDRAMCDGAFGFLTKPFSEKTLIDCIASALNSTRAAAIALPQ